MKLPQNITLVIIYYPHDDSEDISVCEIREWLLSIVQLFFVFTYIMYINLVDTRYTIVILLYRANLAF